MFKKFAAAVVALFVVGAMAAPTEAAFGRDQPIYNVTGAIVGSGSGKVLTLAQVEKAILTASKRRQWLTRKRGDGHIEAWIVVREQHKAVVDIRFTTEVYNITYKSSQNLRYNGRSVHRNYNKWVKNLEGKINETLLNF